MKFLFLMFLVLTPGFSLASDIASNNANINYIGRWTDTAVSSTPIKVAISGGTRFRFQFTGTSLTANFDMGSPRYACLNSIYTTQNSCLASYGCCGYNGSDGNCSFDLYANQDDCQSDGGNWNKIDDGLNRNNGNTWQLTPFYTNEKPIIEYSIDGGTWTRVTIDTSVTIASGLSPGIHTIDTYVAAMDNANNRWFTLAGVRISGFVLDSGAIVSPWPTGLPQMLSIGDSVTEGDVSLCNTPNSSCASGRLSYSTQLADLLGMENWNVAFGGDSFAGMDSIGDIPTAQDHYPYKSNGVPQTDPPFKIILISEGNNDKGAGWENQYDALLSEIVTNNPTAKIFCLGYSYVIVGDFPAAQTECSKYGGTYISTLPLSGLVSLPNLGHPSVADDTVIANYLKPFLAPYVQGITKIPAVRSGDVPLKRTGVPATR